MKVRVYELAKEVGMDSKVLAAKLIELGYDVKSYNSGLDESVADDIRKRLTSTHTEIQEKRIQSTSGGTTVIRRRAKAVPNMDLQAAEEAYAVAEAQAPLFPRLCQSRRWPPQAVLSEIEQKVSSGRIRLRAVKRSRPRGSYCSSRSLEPDTAPSHELNTMSRWWRISSPVDEGDDAGQ